MNALKDPKGQISSKRIVGLGAAALYAGCVVAAMFGHGTPDGLTHGLLAMVLAGIGGATADHFASGGQP